MTTYTDMIETTAALAHMRRAYGMPRAKLRRIVLDEMSDYLIDGMTDRIIGMADGDDMPRPKLPAKRPLIEWFA
jgi:hypothetical protein